MRLAPRRTADTRQQELRRQIEDLIDDAQDGVYGVDREGRATVVTPTVAAMTGHPLGDLVGSAMHELLHHSHPNGECYPRDRCPIYAAFRDGRVHQAEEVFWRKDGTSFPVEYTSTPIAQDGEVVGAVVVFRDARRRQRLRQRLEEALHDDTIAGDAPPPETPIGVSPAWRHTMELVHRVAPADTTTLLVGESGTGKEMVARAIHQASPRRREPLVKLNCAAIPASLVESELFGHERGAFTGAHEQRIGRFEQAGAGTLFLDEIGELPLEAQAKLLRVLQEREFERVGGSRTISCRARMVAATNRDLSALVREGRFRADLYYRLAVFPVRLPPLRERPGDIPLLARHFLTRQQARLQRRLDGFSAQAEAQMRAHPWPGNVRELENVVERAALLTDGTIITDVMLEAQPAPAPAEPMDLQTALERANWQVTGPNGAAAALGIHPNTLRYRMRRLGLARPR